jgi:hypothetical protein
MNNLAHTWKGQGKSDEAVKLTDECVQLRVQTLGAGHPDTRSSSETLCKWKIDKD